MKQKLNNFVVSVKNAVRANHSSVKLANSLFARNLASILVAEGFIESYMCDSQGLRLHLRENALTNICVIRQSWKFHTSKSKKIPRILDGLGIVIVSTCKGIVTDKKARSLNVGGELLCCVW